MQFSVLVDIRLRDGISDPAGATVERALPMLGYEGIVGVTVGKTIRFTIEAADAEAARVSAAELTESFLTNPVIEDADLTVEAISPESDT
ncbi:MAG: phosphoribosylformylglycinamidine synthase subunit PurS [Actinomycetota bacterium]|nr:phosphoribosylformylglycinamidine synthase subunit PurS [Actinomycetota bacterium]